MERREGGVGVGVLVWVRGKLDVREILWKGNHLLYLLLANMLAGVMLLRCNSFGKKMRQH